MLIQCTKKLLDKLNIEPAQRREEDPLFCWHANLITINRRKVVAFVNDKNRYVIVLYGLKAKDFPRLGSLFINALREVLSSECIKDEIAEKYISCAGDIIYTKTKDRSLVAKMRAACDVVYMVDDGSFPPFAAQKFLSLHSSRCLWKNEQGEYVYPHIKMYEDLKAMFGGDIFGCRAAVLKLDLDLEKQKAWRRIIIPLTYSFYDLHKVIQKAFYWMDYHLHEFIIYDDTIYQFLSPDKRYLITHPLYHREGIKPLLTLYCDEEDDYGLREEGYLPPFDDVGFRYVKEAGLSEYIPKYRKFRYRYDFGDNWEIYIDVEEIIEDYDKNYPLCIDGEGNAPPEDVGGKWGYEDFLKIINDEEHQEHNDMLAWAKYQGYGDFSIEEVNKRIKRPFYLW